MVLAFYEITETILAAFSLHFNWSDEIRLINNVYSVVKFRILVGVCFKMDVQNQMIIARYSVITT